QSASQNPTTATATRHRGRTVIANGKNGATREWLPTGRWTHSAQGGPVWFHPPLNRCPDCGRSATMRQSPTRAQPDRMVARCSAAYLDDCPTHPRAYGDSATHAALRWNAGETEALDVERLKRWHAGQCAAVRRASTTAT